MSQKFSAVFFVVVLFVALAGAVIATVNDRDLDGVLDKRDNCPYVANRDQKDKDRDRIGNACDPDLENAVITCCVGENLADDRECFQTSITQCEELDGAVMECLPPRRGKARVGAAVNFTRINQTAQSGWLANLTNAVNLSNVTSQRYRAGYKCHNFTDDLEQYLTTQGFNATFTAFWCYDNAGNPTRAHAVTDVHAPDGSLVFVEPQDGSIVNMDFDGDGTVEARTHHERRKILTDDNCEIEVFDNKAAASAAGVPTG